MNKTQIYESMSPEALKKKVAEIRKMVELGQTSQKAAHDEINLISGVLMRKAVEAMESEESEESEF